MATQSVRQDYNGPMWPLGLITVVTPGTPVGIMSLVDTASVNDPNTATKGSGLTSGTPTALQKEYAPRCWNIIFQGFKAGAHGLQNNAGNIYVLRRGGTGAANRDDYGTMVLCITPGLTSTLVAAPMNLDVFSPYDYQIDADNASDSALVTLVIQ